MKNFEKILAFIFISAITFMGCNSGNTNTSSQEEMTIAEEEEELPYGVTDSVDGEKVSIECAKANYDITELQQRIDDVKSPEMLMHLKADYPVLLDSITKKSSTFSSNEKNITNPHCETLKTSYAKACKEYEVPAEGVISNLKYCIERVNQAQDQAALSRFIDCRAGMLNSLDIIYLCVESKSPRIREIQSLAHDLKNALYDKKVKFGMAD